MQNLRFVVVVFVAFGSILASCTNDHLINSEKTATQVRNSNEKGNSIMIQKTIKLNGKETIFWNKVSEASKTSQVLNEKGNLTSVSYKNGTKINYNYNDKNQMLKRTIIEPNKKSFSTTFEYPNKNTIKLVSKDKTFAIYNLADGNIVKKTYFNLNGTKSDETYYHYNEEKNRFVTRTEMFPFHSLNNMTKKIFEEFYSDGSLQHIESSFIYELNDNSNIQISENKKVVPVKTKF